MVVESPLSSAMPVPSEEDVSTMDALMSDGKRNYICNQPQLAVECFVTLCEKLATFYGQESDKCVEAYLYYGKTLLDIARLENGVLGHAIKEAPVFGSQDEDEGNENDVNTEDDEEKGPETSVDIRNLVEHAMRDENLYNESTEESQSEEEDEAGDEAETEAAGESSKTESGGVEVESKESAANSKKDSTISNGSVSTSNGTSTSNGSASASNGTSTSNGNGSTSNGTMEVDDGIDCDGSDGDDGDEDVSNMELAWEMFELTSFICRRQLEDDGTDKLEVKTRMADAKNGLAQISLETERYEEAVKDFSEVTELFTEILEDKNDRRIAEGHYNIGLALSFDKKYIESIKEFKNAVSILKARVAVLEAKVKTSEEEGSKEKAPVELEEWKKEITELNDLIVLDMMAKIEDAVESNKLLEESIKTVKNAASEIFGALTGTKGGFDAGFDEAFDSPSTTTTEVVHDCSSKIRSVKRKSDDEDVSSSEKKVKQTTTTVVGKKTTTASTEE